MVGKEEYAGYQHILLFSQFFHALLKRNLMFLVSFNLLSVNAFNLDKVKILLSGKELNVKQTVDFDTSTYDMLFNHFPNDKF